MNQPTTNHHPIPARVESAGPVPSATVDPADDHRTFLWRVQISDGLGRERPVYVGLRDGKVVMIAPPNGAGVMTSVQCRTTAAALVLAADKLDEDARAAAIEQARQAHHEGRPREAPTIPPHRHRAQEPEMVTAHGNTGRVGLDHAGGQSIGGMLPGEPLPRELVRRYQDPRRHQDTADT